MVRSTYNKKHPRKRNNQTIKIRGGSLIIKFPYCPRRFGSEQILSDHCEFIHHRRSPPVRTRIFDARYTAAAARPRPSAAAATPAARPRPSAAAATPAARPHPRPSAAATTSDSVATAAAQVQLNTLMRVIYEAQDKMPEGEYLAAMNALGALHRFVHKH